MSEEIEEELKKILADDAYNSGEMQVSEGVRKLALTVRYLVTQLKIAKGFDEIEGAEHICKVIENAKEILS